MRTNRPIPLIGFLLAAAVCLFGPASFAQAGGPRPEGPASPAAQTQPTGTWKLLSSNQSDTWQGDNFHGLKSTYTPIYNGSAGVGAVYTQYNIQFDAKAPLTIASQLTGNCSWSWADGNLPSEMQPGTNYSFSMAADANVTGSNFLGGTVNAYTVDGASGASIAFTQVYLDVNGQVLTGHNEIQSALNFPPGASDGERRTIELVCKVDIVTVKVEYLYEWDGSGCSATLSLPEGMKPNQSFTPRVTVLDSQQKTVTPESEEWFYNDQPSGATMKWDGKDAKVEYRYTCPGESSVRKTSLRIPAAPACSATIRLPDKMEPNKEFSPQAVVVDLQDKAVTPESPAWFYNGAPGDPPMKWDGKTAQVAFEYVCPIDQKPGRAEKTIPPANPAAGWTLVVGGLGLVAAAGLAAAAAGAAILNGGKKGPPPPKYILQVDRRVVEVKANEPAAVQIQAWRILADGSTAPASEAVLKVYVPGSPTGLTATPDSGMGGMRCTFAIPTPTVCDDVPVTLSASVGADKTTAQIVVKVVPRYELELAWHDASRNLLKPGQNEIFAWARLTAVPMPDAKTTPDQLAEKIKLELEGPNQALVQMRTSPPSASPPYVRQGVLWIPLRVNDEAAQPGSPRLRAKFDGITPPLEKVLTLNLEGELVLGAWSQGKKLADVQFNPHLSEPAWDFSEIIAYFHRKDNDSTPVQPAAPVEITPDSLRFNPPVLAVREVFPHAADQYTIRVDLDPGVNLEDHFGRDLSDRNGVIQVNLLARAKTGKEYSTAVSYRLRPQLELFAHPADPKGRACRGVDLEANEFIADGEDRLEIRVGCCRTDQTGPRVVDEIETVDESWWSFQAELRDTSGGAYRADLAEDEPGVRVGSTRPLRHRPDQSAPAFTLHLEGAATDALPSNYLRTPLRADLTLRPRLPDLRLWVVPGKQRGVSEAWVFTCLEGKARLALANTIVTLRIETAGGDGPDLRTNSLEHETGLTTGDDGSEQVNLVYSGMNWDNYAQAVFTVSARMVSKDGQEEAEPVKVTVNVKENVSRLLVDLLDRAEMLKLNNPYYETRSLGLSSLIDLTVYRTFVRGPIWNACEMFSGNESAYAKGDKKAKFAHDYVCSEFRDRISEWLIRRRHYRAGETQRVDEIAAMNGIEFENFIVASGFHNYSGLFLSGMAPADDPRGLDPWWKQSWKDPAYLSPEGLITNNWERYYSVETAGWLTVALTPVAVGTFLGTGGVGTAVFIESLGPIIAAYALGTAGEVAEGTVYSNGQYKWFRGNAYVGRQAFIKDWAAAHGDG